MCKLSAFHFIAVNVKDKFSCSLALVGVRCLYNKTTVN